MFDPPNRRGFIGSLGLAATGALASRHAGAAREVATGKSAAPSRRASELAAAIETMPLLDVHCHPFPALTPVTEEIFLETLALSAWMLDAYFPAEPGEKTTVYAKWRAADPAERERLDRRYGIQRRFDEVVSQMRSTLLVESLVQEMAAFFRCKPTLAQVIAARNEYTKGDFWRYVNDLFGSVRLEEGLVQSGLGVLPAWTEPEPTLVEFKGHLKMKVHEVVTAGASDLMLQKSSFADFVSTYRARLKQQALSAGAVAFKTPIMKTSGADVKPVTDSEAEQAWEQFKKLAPADVARIYSRTWHPPFSKTLQDYIVWQACSVAFELDVPLHIHAGNGEGQDKISTHYPYMLENVARYPVELPQKPVQIVLLHAGYPHHMEAAYMTHIFPNVWFDMSIMTPFSNRGLHQRLLEAFEVAPLSKVMYGSDGYHVPELTYLGAKWAKRHLGTALATLVDEGILGFDDAVRYARMILADNCRKLHKIGASAPAKA